MSYTLVSLSIIFACVSTTDAEWVYRLFNWDSGRTWDDAKENCVAVGWRLLVLDTETKQNDAQLKLSISGLEPWIGFSDVNNNDMHVWLSGGNVGEGYANWALDDPDHGDQNCGYLKDSWTWKDGDCTESRPYVCELDESTIPDYGMTYTMYNWPVDWFTANQTCEYLGQNLVVLDTASKTADVVRQVDLKTTKFWIGFNDVYDNNTYYWLNGEILGSDGSTNWGTDDPDHGDDKCGYVYPTWEWKDDQCWTKRKFICEGNGAVSGVSEDFVHDFGEWTFILSTDHQGWENAKKSCEDCGQRLAVLDTPEKVVAAYVQISLPDTRTWVGFKDINDVNRWLDGTEVGGNGFDNWKWGNPDIGTEPCGYVYYDWLWADNFCDDELRFICETLNKCPAGQYKASNFSCEICPGNTVKSQPDDTDHCDTDPPCDGGTQVPNGEHTHCECSAGHYRVGDNCLMCPGNTIKTEPGDTADCNDDEACDGITEFANVTHTGCETVDCVSWIFGEGGEKMSDDDIDTCADVPQMDPIGASILYKYLVMNRCRNNGLIGLRVTMDRFINCNYLESVLGTEKTSDTCNSLGLRLVPCELTPSDVGQTRDVCTVWCKCADSADQCLVHVFSGIKQGIPTLRICDI